MAISIATQAATACSDCRADAAYASLCEHTAGQNVVMNIVDMRAGGISDRFSLMHTSIYPRVVRELQRGHYVFTRCVASICEQCGTANAGISAICKHAYVAAHMLMSSRAQRHVDVVQPW